MDYEAALRQCAAGQTAAIAGILQRERPRLLRMARRIDDGNAEDIVQTASLRILLNADSFDPARGTARAWMYAILRNEALNSRRNAFREISMETLPEVTTDPFAVDILALRSLIRRLEPRRRASFLMAARDGRSHAEIARLLGVRVNTVKSWVRRDKASIRKELIVILALLLTQLRARAQDEEQPNPVVHERKPPALRLMTTPTVTAMAVALSMLPVAADDAPSSTADHEPDDAEPDRAVGGGLVDRPIKATMLEPDRAADGGPIKAAMPEPATHRQAEPAAILQTPIFEPPAYQQAEPAVIPREVHQPLASPAVQAASGRRCGCRYRHSGHDGRP